MIQSFNNGRFLRYINDNYYIFSGSMLVENGRIAQFSESKLHLGSIIDLNDKLVVPVFKNPHIHLGETLFSPLLGTWNLETYLNYTEYCNNQINNKDELWNYSARLTANECIKYGTGAICSARGINILKDYNIKFFSGYPIMKSNKLKHYIENGLNGYKQFYKECKENNIESGIFLHSLYSNDYESLNLVLECFEYGSSFITTHVAETLQSEKQVIEKFNGKTSVQVLKDYDLLTDKTILVHGGYLTENDLELISKNNSKLVLCPVSNKKLNTICINPQLLDSYNIDWCIGSDGLATGLNANMLYHSRELKKQFQLNNTVVFKSITNNASKVLNFKENEQLNPNFLADFNILENITLKSTKVEDVLDQILNESKISKTYINGNEQIPYKTSDIELEYNNITLEEAIKKMAGNNS